MSIHRRALVWALVLTTLTASLAAPAFVGGEGIWLLPAFAVPLCAAWALGQLVTRRRWPARPRAAWRDARARASMLSVEALALLTGVVVVAFMVALSFAFDGL